MTHAVVLLAAALAAAPQSFRYERPVLPAGRGPQALAIDVPLLSGTASATPLDDFRLFDAAGREVPWILAFPPDPSPDWIPAARVLPLAATREESGFEADLGRSRLVDRLRIEGLGTPLLKRYRLEGSGDRARWTLLVPDGTLFDLPDEKLRLLEAAFPPSEVRWLRVTWDDRKSARPPLPSRAAARGAARRPVAESTKVTVPFERRPDGPGKSRFLVRLPSRQFPVVALRLVVAGGGPLLRPARVLEYRLADDALTPAELGAATLRRAERGGEVAADLAIPIRPPQEKDLYVVVDDGNNPPLALDEVRLDLGVLPWIHFESPDGAPLVARFGAPALSAPRYDLEARRGTVSKARAAAASWGERADRAAPAATGPAPVPPPGAPVTAAFRYRRPVPAASGLVSLALDEAVLAHTRDLGEVRVVDGEGRQVPYLVEKRDEPLTVALGPLPPARREKNVSRYEIALPFDTLPPARLVLTTSAAVFDRRVTLRGRRASTDPRAAPADETLASARFTHADPDTPPPPLVLPFAPSGLARVTLEVDEGDNAPLPLLAPKLLFPAFRLRFFSRAETPLTLCYGTDELSEPRYDLALLAPRFAAADATDLSAGPEGSPPAARAARGAGLERGVFWAVLVGAVVALLAVAARLVAR